MTRPFWLCLFVAGCSGASSSVPPEAGVGADLATSLGPAATDDLAAAPSDAAVVADLAPPAGAFTTLAELHAMPEFELGNCMALDATGTHLATARYSGEVLVYRRDGGAWVQEHAQVVSSLVPGYGRGWLDCALSADGATAVFGLQELSTANHTPNGGAFIFRRTGQTWSLAAQLSTESGTTGNRRYLGGYVAITADGGTAYVTSYDRLLEFKANPTWSTWTRREVQTIDLPSPSYAGMGTGIDLSADGRTMILPGVEFVLRLVGTTWTRGPKLPARDVYPHTGGAALSPDGTRVLTCLNRDGRFLDCTKWDTTGASLSATETYAVDVVPPPEVAGPDDGLWDAELLDDGTWFLSATGAGVGQAKLMSYDPATGMTTRRSAGFHPEGNLAASADGHVVAFSSNVLNTSNGSIRTFVR